MPHPAGRAAYPRQIGAASRNENNKIESNLKYIIPEGDIIGTLRVFTGDTLMTALIKRIVCNKISSVQVS